MKFQYLLIATLIVALTSCNSESESTEKKKNKNKAGIISQTVEYQHIILESTNDYPMTLRSVQDEVVYDRMILDIRLKADGSFTIENENADWDDLEEEVQKFFEMNRKLSTAQTTKYFKNPDYKGYKYPFFTRFSRDSYQSYVDQLSKMAENDMNAGVYLQRHARRIKAFDAVDDKELAFINPLVIIRYVYPDDFEKDKLASFEKVLAKAIVELREELAAEKFNTTYENIRKSAHTDGDARRRLLYLQEMYPAYLMQVKESELEVPEKIKVPMVAPPPQPELIEVTEEEKVKIEMPEN
ncbi:MAG: hypothetical protein ACFHU9_09570 [Fluviicola sp.]